MSRSAGNQALAVLRARIAELETELVAERQQSANLRADLERGDQLVTEIAELRATLAALREAMTLRVRPWWRRWKHTG
jgi:hypothetical protein